MDIYVTETKELAQVAFLNSSMSARAPLPSAVSPRLVGTNYLVPA